MLLQDYNPAWVRQFEQIEQLVLQQLKRLEVSIEHIGSTSIPGIMAKPIIDIDLVYYDFRDFPVIITKLAAIGYSHEGDLGIKGREAFKRTDNVTHPILDGIIHHLYVCHHKNEELTRHLSFRDFLRKNAMARQEYELLKSKIAEIAKQEKKAYAVLKENMARTFVEKILKLASTQNNP